jgi:integrase
MDPELTTPEGFIFANAIGGAMDPGNWYRREWTPTLEKVGLVDVVGGKIRPRFHFHELRHYAATRLDELGMSAKLRTEIVGHANEETTNSVYTHVSRARVAAAAREFDPL